MEALAASFNWVIGHERKTVALSVLPPKWREVLRNNEFYQKRALSFTIQYTLPADKKVTVSSVLQLNVLLKCYDTPESDYYFTTVHWRVGVNGVFDLV